MKKIFILGSMNMDLVISSERMPLAGETIIGSDFLMNPGGKGANQAITCGKLGAYVTLIGTVGLDSYGTEIIDNLRKHNVNVEYINKTSECNTGIAIIILTEKDNRIIIDHGANHCNKYEHIEKCLNGSAPGDIFLTQFEVEQNLIIQSLKKAKQMGLYTILNPAPAINFNKELLYDVDLLILNETETMKITQIEPLDDESIKDIYNYFKEYNILNIIITLGKKGVVTMINGVVTYIDSVKVNTVDTTAAGDSFVGCIAYELSLGNDLFSAIKKSNIVAAMTVTKKGAQNSIPTKEEVIQFIKDNHLLR